MTEDTKQMAIVSFSIVIVLSVTVFSLRSCTLETTRLNAEVQAKCIAAGGVWDTSNSGALGRCILGRQQVAS